MGAPDWRKNTDISRAKRLVSDANELMKANKSLNPRFNESTFRAGKNLYRVNVDGYLRGFKFDITPRWNGRISHYEDAYTIHFPVGYRPRGISEVSAFSIEKLNETFKEVQGKDIKDYFNYSYIRKDLETYVHRYSPSGEFPDAEAYDTIVKQISQIENKELASSILSKQNTQSRGIGSTSTSGTGR